MLANKQFKREFEVLEGEVGAGWKCTEVTAAHRRGKQYELA
jgi:hypothetical protein